MNKLRRIALALAGSVLTIAALFGVLAAMAKVEVDYQLTEKPFPVAELGPDPNAECGKREELRRAIGRAYRDGRRCEMDSDCTLLRSGCGTAVAKSAVATIMAARDEYARNSPTCFVKYISL